MGTWVHPRVAIHVAQWISPQFAVKVTEWVEEWYRTSETNRDLFMHEITHLEASPLAQMERDVQNKLAAKYMAQKEVRIEVGFIDLLTDDELIEIKEGSSWKQSIGQVLAYGEFYPSHKKKIVLFGELSNDLATIKRICGKHAISVEVYTEEDVDSE